MFKQLFLLTCLLSSLVISGCGSSASPEATSAAKSESNESNAENTTPPLEVEQPEITPIEPSEPEEIIVVWTLKPAVSFINFVSTKKVHVVESHTFGEMDGIIDSDGLALMQIGLESVDTGIALRDQRMRDLFFETNDYPLAEVSTQVDLDTLQTLELGEVHTDAYQVNLNLHGLTVTIDAPLTVKRISETQTLVRTQQPILINALDFNFSGGLDELKALAKLTSISQVVPVDLFLVFERAEQE